MNIRAKKRYGQNFLIDLSILDTIIEAMPKNDNYIVEIGPGLGDLTKKLVSYKDMIAYEIDSNLFTILGAKFQNEIASDRLKVVHGDILEVWVKQKTLHKSRYDLISNLPYYIATNIILRALEDFNCEHIIVMVQKEVAHKFISKVNERDFSSLSIIVESLTVDSKILCDVSPQSFHPVPKVVSSILYLKKDMNKKINDEFKAFLKACFIQPRKKLLKNLSLFFNDKDFLRQIFKELNIKEIIRPHEVSTSLYSQMYTKVKNARK